ncbi:MAG: hypothetical protein DWQ01_11220 [Planctomycetota bacterium]|nr:MAG: hypothetical protein DWQ01_11220 [Planctomycetota bacterium]
MAGLSDTVDAMAALAIYSIDRRTASSTAAKAWVLSRPCLFCGKQDPSPAGDGLAPLCLK